MRFRLKRLLCIVACMALVMAFSTNAMAAGKIKDGTYNAKFTCTGGSGRGGITAVSLNVSGGNMKATITMSSDGYTKAVVGGTTYTKQGSGNSQFTFPVSALDTGFSVVATTEKMSTAHDINYTLTIKSDSLPTESSGDTAPAQQQQQEQPKKTQSSQAQSETPSSSVEESSTKASSTEASSTAASSSAAAVTTVGESNGGGGVNAGVIIAVVVVVVAIAGGAGYYFVNKKKKGN